MGKNYKNAAYTALQASGAALPEQRNLANLAGCVETLPLGMGTGTDELVPGPYGVVEYFSPTERTYKQIQLATAAEFGELAQNRAAPAPSSIVPLGGMAIPMWAFTRFRFAPGQTVPGHLLEYAVSLKRVEGLEQAIFTNTSEFFLNNCWSLDSPLTFPESSAAFGNNILTGCYSLNSPVVLPPNLTQIGQRFMAQCFSFQQHLALPGTLKSTGAYFMCLYSTDWIEFYQQGQFTGILEIAEGAAPPGEASNALYSLSSTLTSPSFTEGITLTGGGAQAWKNALVSMESGRVGRKLILGDS